MRPSNLPPGVTDKMIEDQQAAECEYCDETGKVSVRDDVIIPGLYKEVDCPHCSEEKTK